MSDETEATRTRTPWHLWVVGGLSALWNSYGGYDYVMSHIGGDRYLTGMGMTGPQIAFFHAMPAWTTAAWAVGVWGALLGSALLLLRLKWALHAFAASLAGLLASLVHTYLLSNGAELMGPQSVIMYAVITGACLFFVRYAWTMTRKGVLR
jgi:hypothetical protein